MELNNTIISYPIIIESIGILAGSSLFLIGLFRKNQKEKVFGLIVIGLCLITLIIFYIV
jgi:hypothetical protein